MTGQCQLILVCLSLQEVKVKYTYIYCIKSYDAFDNIAMVGQGKIILQYMVEYVKINYTSIRYTERSGSFIYQHPIQE